MGQVKAGIKELYFGLGTLDIPALTAFPTDETDPNTYLYGMGIRQEGSLVVEHKEQLSDKDGREFPNLLNFKAEMSTMQVDLNILNAVMQYAGVSETSVAVLASGVYNDGGIPPYVAPSLTLTPGGIYIFDGADAMGVDFELSIGMKERLLKLTFERAYKYSYGLTLIDNADAATNKIPFGAGVLPMIKTADVLAGFISPTWATSLTGLTNGFEDARLVDFNMVIKSKSDKNAFGVSLVRGVEVELTATASGPSVPEIKSAISHEFVSDVTIGLRTGQDIILKADGISKIGSAEIGDAKREITVSVKGYYDMEFVTSTASAITFNTYLQ